MLLLYIQLWWRFRSGMIEYKIEVILWVIGFAAIVENDCVEFVLQQVLRNEERPSPG